MQSTCEMMWNGQKPALLIGGSRCAETSELNDILKSWQFVFNLYEKHRSERETARMRMQKIPSHGIRRSSRGRQTKNAYRQSRKG